MAEYYRFWDDASNNWKLRSGLETTAGAADQGKLVALNALGQIDNSMLPTSSLENIVASEAIAAGAAVNKYDNGGTINIRNADASNNRPAHGFAVAAIASAAAGDIDSDGLSTQAGLTLGATYYLSTTAGAIVTDPVESSGNLLQKVGTASSATILNIEIGEVSTFE